MLTCGHRADEGCSCANVMFHATKGPSPETPGATRPICGKCGKPMSPEDATIHPELFMHDACLPTELLLREAQAGASVGVEQKE